MKERIDIILVNRGLCNSRDDAKRNIMAGNVLIGTERVDKPAEKYEIDCNVVLKQKQHNYVSRGGLKLEKALKVFNIDPKDKVLMDVGSSTGGFTDCALQNGAKKSYAIDVGTNQLAYKLRIDDRVVVMEKTNFRNVTIDMFDDIANLVSIDVSFISLELILPIVREVVENNSSVLALIKPQFEAGKESVGKGGIIKDPLVHIDVINKIIDLAYSLGYGIYGLDYSPIKGSEGNIEFLIHLKVNSPNVDFKLNVDKFVKNTHNELKKNK